MMNIRPLQDRVILKRMEEETTSPGGIVIPDSASRKACLVVKLWLQERVSALRVEI